MFLRLCQQTDTILCHEIIVQGLSQDHQVPCHRNRQRGFRVHYKNNPDFLHSFQLHLLSPSAQNQSSCILIRPKKYCQHSHELRFLQSLHRTTSGCFNASIASRNASPHSEQVYGKLLESHSLHQGKISSSSIASSLVIPSPTFHPFFGPLNCSSASITDI